MVLAFPAQRLGVLLVVSGPSGSGKTTLCRRLRDGGQAVFSVSCTTRQPRPGEVDGRDYYFVSEAEFRQRLALGEFLEHATVHGNLYGTLNASVTALLQRGTDVLLDIDVQGAAQVRGSQEPLIRQCHTDVFILPPSMEELRARLDGRGTDNPDTVALRMANALAEMERWRDYRYVIVSGHPDDDFTRFQAILHVERLRTERFLTPSAY
ncbi:MAG: guanylate kinase [Roseimicrobium sp.]